MHRSGDARGVWLASVGVFIISFDSLLIRLQGLPIAAVAFWRGVLTAVGFALLSWFAYRGRTLSAFGSIGVGVVGVALFTAISKTMFVVAVTHTTVADTLVILASAPLMTAVLGRVLLGERLHVRTWAAGTVVLVGVLGILQGDLGHGGIVGDLAALAVSLSVSMVLVILRKFQDIRWLAAMSIGGLLAAGAVAPFVGNFSLNVEQGSFAALNGIAVLPIGLALVSTAPRYIAASKVSLITLIEVVLGPMWVWWVLHEIPAPQTLLSGALIGLALLVHFYLDLRSDRDSISLGSDAGGSSSLPA